MKTYESKVELLVGSRFSKMRPVRADSRDEAVRLFQFKAAKKASGISANDRAVIRASVFCPEDGEDGIENSRRAVALELDQLASDF